MVTSDFRPECMGILPFRARAMKNTQYNPYLWPNHRTFHVLKEIGKFNTVAVTVCDL